MNKQRVVGAVVLFGVAVAGITCMSCQGLRRQAVKAMTPSYSAPSTTSMPDGGAALLGSDAQREVVQIKLALVAKDFTQPTDLCFVPTEPRVLVVLEKEGAMYAVNLDGTERNKLLTLDVTTPSEMGLLGIAFHPKYAENGRLFLNFTTKKKGDDISRVQEFIVPRGASLLTAKPAPGKILYEVKQPYPNHNAGQLQFGPDGFLYVGWGDGGYRDDPHGHGQDLKTALGSMLRIDVDGEENGKPYRIPKDNPFLGKAGVLPETWAYGLRNPWRYSFDEKGRLIVADVGQDRFEEIHILKAGDNAGWNIREGRHCFEPREGCRTEGIVEPIYEYPRDDGRSITGGYVYLGSVHPSLKGQYVFADFLTGRFWAIPLPEEVTPQTPMVKATALGQFSVLPSAFARDDKGELYFADFGAGTISQLK